MWAIHWDLAPEAALKSLGLPLVQAKCWGGAAFWDVGVLAAPDTQGGWWLVQQEIYSALEGYGNQYLPVHSIILSWRTPLTEKPGRPQSIGLQRVRHGWSNPACIDTRLLLLWQLCHSDSWAWRCHNCLACGDPGSTLCAETWTDSATGVMVLSDPLSEPLIAGNQKASLASLSP